MVYYSKVADSVFTQIKLGKKVVEPRLNDAMHKQVRIGDMIVVINRSTKEELVAKVVGILRYASFKDMFAALPSSYFGVDDIAAVQQEVGRWYDPVDEAIHGVIGIKLHVLRPKV